MKKLLTMVVIIAMVTLSLTVLASCNNNGATAETTATDVTNEAGVTTAGEEQTTSANTEKKVLKMATNAYFRPYEYYDGNNIVGIDVEIAKAIADKLDMELEIMDMGFDAILTAVDNGTADFGMAGMTVTKKRKESVDFSNSYASGVQVIIVKNDSTVKTVDDLSNGNYKIGTQFGTTGYIYTSDTVENGGYGEDRVIGYNTGDEAILALLKGDIECVIIDNEPAKAFVESNSGLKILDTHYADEDYAICLKKGNSRLLDEINTAIYELSKDGTIDSIVDKYIK